LNVDSSLYGTIMDLFSYREFGETKAKSFVAESTANPNTRYAFFGDNGQGDVCGAASMLSSTNGNRLKAVFIHLVIDPSESLNECEDPSTGRFTLDLPESDVVHYHKTHSNATEWALMSNLISCCSANNVYAAVQEWVACRCDGTNCDALPTGVSIQATREETLSYCEEVKIDQALLKQQLDICDPQGECRDRSAITTTPSTNVNSSSSNQPTATSGGWSVRPAASVSSFISTTALILLLLFVSSLNL